MLMARTLRSLAVLLAAKLWLSHAARTQVSEDSSGGAVAASSAEASNPIVIGVLAADRARRERERRERERRERERRERERRERERKAAHIRNNKRDCSFEEQWHPWGECSADCGGGIKTSVLASRVITQRQDSFGYGKRCPAECSDSSKAGCGQEKHSACAVDICPSDCSRVDLGNRLPGPGSPVEWTWSGSGEKCVFQFWQVLEGSEGPRVRLLAQTSDRGYTGPDSDPTVTAYLGTSGFVVHAEGGPVAHSDVAIGWRGCSLGEDTQDPELQRLPLLSVCLYGREGFQEARSTRRELSKHEKAALRELQRESRAKWSTQLARVAGRGVGPGDEGVVMDQASDGWLFQDLPAPSSTLRVTMALQPPMQPQLNTRSYAEVGDDIRLDVHAPLSSSHVSVRRVFGAQKKGYCKFIPVPSCDAVGQAPCVDPDLTLRNFPLASHFELQLATSNDAGMSRPATMFFQTRGQSGVPLKECMVNYWSCAGGGDSDDIYPEEDDPECGLTAPPLPVCRMEPRKTFTRELKCDGKKYWRTCRAFMKRGDEACVSPMQKVCVHSSSHLGEHDRAEPCEARGCSTSMFSWNKKTCCCESSTDPESDSPRCACSSTSCEDLGLSESFEPEFSCRH